MSLFVGIDPGAKGALAALDRDGLPVALIDWAGGPRETLEAVMAALPTGRVALCALELVHSMPRQGVASTFSFGANFGMWRGLTAAWGWPLELVTPARWRGAVPGLPARAGKDQVLTLAKARFPQADIGKKDGRADALWLAEYARREMLGGKRRRHDSTHTPRGPHHHPTDAPFTADAPALSDWLEDLYPASDSPPALPGG